VATHVRHLSGRRFAASDEPVCQWEYLNIRESHMLRKTLITLSPRTLSRRLAALRRTALLVCILAGCLMHSACGIEQPTGNFKNPAAVKEVLSGKRTVANAAWWGFETADSTSAVQAAIRSGAAKVIIPYMPSQWVVRPVELAANQEIVFEPGVVVVAKKGEFKGKNDCLLTASGKKNITLRGYGAILQMQKEDYVGPGYQQSEWRHVLSIAGCTNVKVLGLTLKDSGGDGIYLGQGGAKAPPCKDILIKDCTCDNNYRQGISVISAENLLIANCLLKNTSGHSPSAGIDIEPNESRNRLTNIVVSNCIAQDNQGRGFVVSLNRLTGLSADISVRFVDCYVKGCGRGLEVVTNGTEGPKGAVEFGNCVIEDTLSAGLWIVTNTRSFDLSFVNCKIRNANSASAFPDKKYIFSDSNFRFPIVLRTRKQRPSAKTGAIRFAECSVYDDKPRPSIYVRTSGTGVINAEGTVHVQNKLAGELVAGPDAKNLALKVGRLGP
jgi:polygalacturonase